MILKSSIRDLEYIDNRLTGITKGLSIESGSLFRVACQYLKNWGISVTRFNQSMMERRAAESNRDEWKGGGEELDDIIHLAVADARLIKNNTDHNTLLADMAVNILFAMDDGKRTFRIADLGCGAGSTSEALLDKLDGVFGAKGSMEFASRIELFLYDPSAIRLAMAEAKLSQNTLKVRKVRPIGGPIPEAFDFTKDGFFDIMISSAALHHISFPTYLHEIRDKLVSDGVFVVGDWYHTFHSHPAYTLRLIRKLVEEECRMIDALVEDSNMKKDEAEKQKAFLGTKAEEFSELFGVQEKDLKGYAKVLTEHQRKDNEDALNYLVALGRRMREAKIKAAQEEGRKKELGELGSHEKIRKILGAKFFFLEALESFPDRKAKIEQAGFVTDLGELKDKHRGFKFLKSNITRAYPPDRDLANVIAVGKVRNRRTRVRG